MKNQRQGISRRSFIAGIAGSSLMMGMGSLVSGCSSEQASDALAAGDLSTVFSPNIWFEINGAGEVLINIVRAEMGQHVGTSLAQIIADELGADWSKVSFKHVDTDPKWGVMVTGGSWSVHQSFTQLSQAGAAGRTLLIDAAAKILDVAPDTCTAENGVVTSGAQTVSFAEIVTRGDFSRVFSEEELAAMPVKTAAQRNVIGQNLQNRDVEAKSQGDAVYGLDTELPGMAYAMPLLPPTRYGSSVVAIDDSAAKSIAGYIGAVQINDPTQTVQGCVVVAAETMPAALKAAKAVSVEWVPGPTALVTEADILAEGERLAADPEQGALFVNEGDVLAAKAQASVALSATYTTSTALHFTMEPQNALVEFDSEGRCHIHAGNQWQSLILPVLAQALEMPETDIVIHQYYLGGGYGRRLFGDQMIPAALAARSLGRPVKLIFDRASDSRFDCVRSPSVCTLEAFFDSDGALTGVDHAVVAGWPTKSMAPFFLGPGIDGKGEVDGFSVNGADHWYTLPAHRVRTMNNALAQETFLPGWLRAVGPGWVSWGVESFLDEIADQQGEDPVALRLKLLDAVGKNAGDTASTVGGAKRLAAVLKDVTRRAEWGRQMPANEGLGVAVGHGQERGMPTWVACVAHVAVDVASGEVALKKLWQTIDVGTVVNPDGAMAQAEGAALWGVSLALHEGARFNAGEVAEQNLDRYTPLRMRDVPELDISFVDSQEFPSGLGEPPLIPVAPAIGNAVFAATGQRVRKLPIRLA
ncbi:molybdopterin-dependent oxidoreductase [Luminiphilus sp.]|jgi:CO/xanthine dehydrogenase Mo-binding subunit|nr:molybdopterin-dependent oxidoreductase [Luminiphilus sp.]MDB2557197.1 molybdopterin-dependent oxidoreductase [Luminiphilus sp.]